MPRLLRGMATSPAALAPGGGDPPALSQSYRVLKVGDSATWGQGSGTTGGQTNARPNSPPVRVAEVLNTAGIPAICESNFGLNGNGNLANLIAYDAARWPGFGDWNAGSADLSIGTPLQEAAAGNPARIVVFNSDTIILRFLGSVTGSGTYSIDGGAPVGFSTTGTNTVLALTITGLALGTHTVDLAWVSGTVSLWTFEGQNRSRNEVRIIAAGTRGAGSVDLVQNSNSRPFRYYNANAVLLPDLVVLNIGINDRNNGVALATYDTNMRSYLTRIRAINPAVKIIIEIPADISTGAALFTNADMRSALTQIATDFTATLFDRQAYLGGYGEANAAGYMYDFLHPNAAGYGQFTPHLAASVRTALGI